MKSYKRPPGNDYWVEIWNDENSAYITISTHHRFDAALGAFKALTSSTPAMRVVMRHRAHVFRNYIPARLDNCRDRNADYPT